MQEVYGYGMKAGSKGLAEKDTLVSRRNSNYEAAMSMAHFREQDGGAGN
jgi:hypothetical protein